MKSRFVAVLCAALVHMGVVCGLLFALPAQAAIEDCIGQNRDGGVPGKAECTKPIPGPWSMGYCPNEGANQQVGQQMCACSGGTWGYNTGCVGGREIKDEAELVAQATCFAGMRYVCGNPSVNWAGWSPIGASTDQFAGNCAHYEAKMVQGVEISNFSIMNITGLKPDQNNNCTVPSQIGPMPAGKGRQLNCPAGYNGRGLSDGSMECYRFPACPTCNGELQPGDGSVSIPQGVYSGTGPYPLQMNLQYSSYPFYSTVGGTDRSVYGFGTNWVSGYHRRVFTDPTNAGLLATVQRATGAAKSFDLQGNEVGVLTGNDKDKLEKLTNGGGAVTGWKYTNARNDEVENYNAEGLLTSVQNRFGLTQTLTYSDANTPSNVAPRAGLLIKVSDPFGKELNFTHDSEGRVVHMADPAGGQFDFQYDGNGNLRQITFPNPGSGTRPVRQYLYAEPGYGAGNLPYHLTGIIDENGNRYSSYSYNGYGWGVATERAGGTNRMQVVYDRASFVRHFVGDPDNPQTTYRQFVFANVDGKLKPSGFYEPNSGQSQPCVGCGGAASIGYDSNGFVASRRDWNGNLTCYTNDVRGLETKRVEGLSGTTCPGSATAATRTVTTTWHASFHLPLSVAEPLRITTYTYDTNGNLLTRSVQATSDASGAAAFSATAVGAPRAATYTYNGNGQVLTVDGPRSDVTDVTTYTYYANNDLDKGKRGNVASVTNALSQTTQITAYNANGQPLTIVDPNGLTTQLAYDGLMRLVSRNVGGEITTYAYDVAGQLIQQTLPDASTISYTYDEAQRLVAIQDNQGNRISYSLDLMGNRVREVVQDPAGQLAQARSRAYDVLNRLQKDIGAQNQVTQYTYDTQGNLTAVADPLNRVTNSTYDALNRLASMTQPAPAAGQQRPVIGYAYNGLDQLVQVTDPRLLATTYAYDGLGNMNTQVSPDTGTTANTYDIAGNVLTSTDAKSQVTTYTYDALNRVATVVYNQATGTQLKTVAYAYDQGTNGIGRLTTVTETAADGTTVMQTTQYGYDQKGRLTQETRTLAGQAFVTAYAYDQATGRMTGMTYPSGRTLAFAYDSVGRINQISTTGTSAQGGQTQALVAGVTYQPFGGVKGYVLGNNQAISRPYDQDGRVAGYNLGNTNYSVGYDQAGRIINILNLNNTVNSNAYGYDDLDRLILASLPGNSSYAYSYDLTGNRLSKGYGSGGGDSYTISPTSNQLSQISGGSARSFTYDPNGSTTGDSNNNYTYDARGRMNSAQNSAGTTQYQVGANGQRVRKSGPVAGDVIYIYDAQGKLISEATPAGQIKKEYFYLADLPVAVFVQ